MGICIVGIAMLLTFLATMTGGMLGVLALCRVEQITWKFLRLIAILGLSGFAATTAWALSGSFEGVAPWPTAAIGFSMAGFLAGCGVLEGKASWIRGCGAVGGALGLAAAWCWGMSEGIWPTESAIAQVSTAGGLLLGGFLLGSVTLTWLLGHAYLTASAMTIAPLRRLSRLFIAAVATRSVFSLACLTILWFGTANPRGEAIPPALMGPILMILVRVLVGLIVAGVFAYMVWDCARLRSTQSATGIAFFASLCVVIGELAGQYVIRATAFPM
jgi:hypothetical protein